ncbi:MAG: hypothetical protein AAB338_01575 [Patescibacteria group bacterium]
MFGLIKLIFILILLAAVAVYGGDIWSTVKDKITGFTNPELQRATLFNVSKNKIKEIENIIKEVKENIDNPNFDKKAKLEESLKIIQESKNNLEKIENSGETLIEKAFEGLNDLKEGAQNLLSDSKSKTGEAQTCP